MTKTSRESPYVRLVRIFKQWLLSVDHPHTKMMWRYPKDKLGQGWSILDLYERVQAADQLGYRVEVRAAESGLEVYYVKRPNEKPWELRDS